ncbi:MAG: hypothetical protein JKY93_11255 [Gammaproteobacteria bacterium]|nr:hypothetical protein [Gammaproteobacteria bacterium]
MKKERYSTYDAAYRQLKYALNQQQKTGDIKGLSYQQLLVIIIVPEH